LSIQLEHKTEHHNKQKEVIFHRLQHLRIDTNFSKKYKGLFSKTYQQKGANKSGRFGPFVHHIDLYSYKLNVFLGKHFNNFQNSTYFLFQHM